MCNIRFGVHFRAIIPSYADPRLGAKGFKMREFRRCAPFRRAAPCRVRKRNGRGAFLARSEPLEIHDPEVRSCTKITFTNARK